MLKNILVCVLGIAIGVVGYSYVSSNGLAGGTTNFNDLSIDSLTVSGDVSMGDTNLLSPFTAEATGTTTLTVAQSGGIFGVSTSTTHLVLPAVASSAGVHYRFVVTEASIAATSSISSATADKIEGSLIVAGAVVDCNASDVVSINPATENIGDFIDFFSDGSYWYPAASGFLTSGAVLCEG